MAANVYFYLAFLFKWLLKVPIRNVMSSEQSSVPLDTWNTLNDLLLCVSVSILMFSTQGSFKINYEAINKKAGADIL